MSITCLSVVYSSLATRSQRTMLMRSVRSVTSVTFYQDNTMRRKTLTVFVQAFPQFGMSLICRKITSRNKKRSKSISNPWIETTEIYHRLVLYQKTKNKDSFQLIFDSLHFLRRNIVISVKPLRKRCNQTILSTNTNHRITMKSIVKVTLFSVIISTL